MQVLGTNTLYRVFDVVYKLVCFIFIPMMGCMCTKFYHSGY